MAVEEQRVLIIGGTSGIGLVTAREVVDRGGRVVIAGRKFERAVEVADFLGDAAQGAEVNISDPKSVIDLPRQTGDVDHVVLSAASLTYGRFLEIDLDAARDVFETKFWGYFRVARVYATRLPQHGSFTFFSGVAADRPQSGSVAVTAVNAAVEGLTRSLAIELAPVRVNAVSPGVVDTSSWDRLSAEERASMFDQVAASLPVRRIGRPTDVARAVVELIDNGFTTGEVRHVDGGARIV
ncbi:MAG TPA: SDR family oxidoreductase [Pseudonocardiaceae bacterium]|nr:SDR family oxidoreductase [Pseudonocardiaceae bacterium]